jgi:YD repeat-containing protein
MKLQPNTLYADRYLLVQKLGSGGFSEVWLAEDTKGNNIRVALKVFAPGNGLDSNGLKVFADEYSLVFQLNHPNLLKPTHFDTWNDQPYLVMQFMEKGSCTRMVGEFTEAELARFMFQMADALHYLHDQEPPIVHQDIKPDNVLMDQRGNYLLTDFGISTRIRKTLTKSMGNQTVSSGTTAYMAPERFSRRLEERAPIPANDIFSLGITLFELLTDELPFGEQGGLVAAGGLEPAELPEQFDQGLQELIAACLEKNTMNRPTAEELAQAAKTFMEQGQWLPPARLKEPANDPLAMDDPADRKKAASRERKTAVIPDTQHADPKQTRMAGAGTPPYGATKLVQQQPARGEKGTVIYGQQGENPEGPGKKKKRTLFIAGTAALAVVVILAVIFWDTLTGSGQQKANFYRQISFDSRGEFFGRYPLQDQDSAIVNCYHFRYDEKGHISGWTYQKGGKPAFEPYFGVASVEIMRGEKSARYVFQDIYGNPMSTNKGVFQWEYLYDEKGNPIRENLLDKNGNLMLNSEGIAWYTLELENDGKILKAKYHDLSGNVTSSKDSISGYRATYNEQGYLAEVRYLGRDGHPVPLQGGGHFGTKWEYDEFGNIIREVYCDANGNPMLLKNHEISAIEITYDLNGNRTGMAYKDSDGRLTVHKNERCAVYSYEYDSAGNLLQVAYRGADDLPLKLDSIVYPMLRYAYDTWGNAIETYYTDLAGNRVMHPGGLTYAVLKKQYDDRRNVIAEQYYGTDEKPALQYGYFFTARYSYDAAGRKIEESWYAADGQAVIDPFYGWAIRRHRYNEKGQRVESTGYDTKGAVAEGLYGYAIERPEYTFDGKWAKSKYYDRNDKFLREYVNTIR